MYKFVPYGISTECPPSKHPLKPASTSSSVPRICLYTTMFDEEVKFKGICLPKDQMLTFYTNGDIEYRDGNGIRNKNVGSEITISDVESLGKKFLT